MAGLIKRGQAADITSALDKAGVKDELNSSMVDLASKSGKTYGCLLYTSDAADEL